MTEHTEFTYDFKFLTRLINEIKKRPSINLLDFDLPDITPNKKGVPYIRVSDRVHYTIRYIPVPRFNICFSQLSEKRGVNKTVLRDVIYYKFNSTDPNNVNFNTLIPVKGKYSIDQFVDKFGEWLNGIIQHNEDYAEYEASKLPNPEVIDLNEDKPFSDAEIKILENSKNQIVSNLREHIKRLPESENKTAAEQALPEIEKELEESITEAKDKTQTKPQWYKKFFNRTVKVIRLLKDIKDSVELAQWLMGYSFFDMFKIFLDVNFNFKIALDSTIEPGEIMLREFIVQVLIPIVKLHTIGAGA